MNVVKKNLFYELQDLVNKLEEHKEFLNRLKENNSACQDVMTIKRGFSEHKPDQSILPVLIDYYEEKVQILKNQIDKFILYKG